MPQDISAIVIARQGSTRLPGKALRKAAGFPIVGHIVRRLQAAPELREVTIATSTRPEDDAIEAFGKSEGISVFRGHPEDVLDRLYHAAVGLGVEAIVAIGGDCPFVGPDLIREGVDVYRKRPADIVSNALESPFTFPVGYDFILVRTHALERAHKAATLPSVRAIPFQIFLTNPDQFTTVAFHRDPDLNTLRWTLDYPEDLEFVQTVYAELFTSCPNFGLPEVLALLAQKPQIGRINAMHAERVSGKSVWYTGCYVAMTHKDIRDLLAAGAADDEAGHFEAAASAYRSAQGLLNDLVARAEHKQHETK